AGGRLGAGACPTGAPTAQSGGRRHESEEPASFAALFRGLIDCTQTLFRQEMRLARAEMSEKAREAGRNTAAVAAGGAVALLGGFALVLAACGGLYSLLLSANVSPGVAMWVAPLIVGVVVAGIGYAMIQKGLSTLRG